MKTHIAYTCTKIQINLWHSKRIRIFLSIILRNETNLLCNKEQPCSTFLGFCNSMIGGTIIHKKEVQMAPPPPVV